MCAFKGRIARKQGTGESVRGGGRVEGWLLVTLRGGEKEGLYKERGGVKVIWGGFQGKDKLSE